MPVPSSIADLNVDPEGNYPKGTDEVGSTPDDFYRSGFAIMRQMHASEYGIPAANTLAVHPHASTFYVSGTGVEVYAIADRCIGGQITIVFQEAGVNLIDGGGLSLPAGLPKITTLAGDNGVFINDRAGHWTCLSYNRSDGSALIAAGYVKRTGGDTLTGSYSISGPLAVSGSITVSGGITTPANGRFNYVSVDSVAVDNNHLVPLSQVVSMVNDLANKIKATRIGTVFWHAGITAPNLSLLCNGAEHLIANYPDLFNVINTRYGGNGTTTFCVPNLSNGTTVIAGFSSQEIGSFSTGSFPSHSHEGSILPGGSFRSSTDPDGRHAHAVSGPVTVTVDPENFVLNIGSGVEGINTSPGGNMRYKSGSEKTGRGTFYVDTSYVSAHGHSFAIPDHTHGLSISFSGVGNSNLPAGTKMLPCIWAF